MPEHRICNIDLLERSLEHANHTVTKPEINGQVPLPPQGFPVVPTAPVNCGRELVHVLEEIENMGKTWFATTQLFMLRLIPVHGLMDEIELAGF